jgi:predicted permease
VLTGFAAIWVVTAAGWLVGRWDVLGPRAERVLARLVFFVLTPALLFITLSRTDPADLARPALAAFAAGALVTGAVGAALARWRWGRPLGETVVAALCASYANAGNLGIPIAAYVLGDVAAVAPVLLFQSLLVAPLALAVLDRTDGAADRRTGFGPARLFLFAGRNPIMLGSAAGIAVAASGWRPPDEALRPVELLGSAAVPVALLALGLALAGSRSERARPGAAPATAAQAGGRRGAERGWAAEHPVGPVYALVALKALVHPALAYLVARLLGLGGPALLAAAVTAALPTAQNVYVFAARYERAEPLARDVVLLSTLVAAATTGVLAVWLG